MARLNVQADVRARLSEALPDAVVGTSVPDPRPERLVVVRREGGAVQDALIDRAGVGVDVWAESEAACADLCCRASEAMRALPFGAGYASVEEEAMLSQPVKGDPPHWYASYTVKTFRP